MMSRFFAQLLRARIGGHPIHSMLVHFPSALFPMSLFFDILAVWLRNPCLTSAAFYCLAAGLITGLAAACVGAVDYSRVPSTHPAWNEASLHGLLNVTWITLFSIVLGLKLKYFPNFELASPTQMIISAISIIGLIYSNYLGGNMIFRHKLGFDE